MATIAQPGAIVFFPVGKSEKLARAEAANVATTNVAVGGIETPYRVIRLWNLTVL